MGWLTNYRDHGQYTVSSKSFARICRPPFWQLLPVYSKARTRPFHSNTELVFTGNTCVGNAERRGTFPGALKPSESELNRKIKAAGLNKERATALSSVGREWPFLLSSEGSVFLKIAHRDFKRQQAGLQRSKTYIEKSGSRSVGTNAENNPGPYYILCCYCGYWSQLKGRLSTIIGIVGQKWTCGTKLKRKMSPNFSPDRILSDPEKRWMSVNYSKTYSNPTGKKIVLMSITTGLSSRKTNVTDFSKSRGELDNWPNSPLKS